MNSNERYRLEEHQLNALYDHIVAYKRECGGRAPTRMEISAALGLNSTALAQAYLRRLERDGRIGLGRLALSRDISIPGERWFAARPVGGGGQMTEKIEQQLTIRQVAAELGITRQAVLSAIRDGRLTASVVGKRPYCTRADVDAWLAAREERRKESLGRKATGRKAQTERDEALYDFIIGYKRQHGGRSPTRTELAASQGLKSKSNIQQRLNRLAASGRIVLEENDSRNIAIPGERWLAPGEAATEEHSGR